MRTRHLLFVTLLALASVPFARGASKEIIQLQAQVQALQDQMTQMRQSFDERMGVMKNLVEQSTDNLNQMSAAVSSLEKRLSEQNTDTASKVDDLSGQVQALHDSLDELKSRLAKISKQLDDMNAARENLGAAGGPLPPQAPPPDVLYNNALRDFTAARYPLSSQEFMDYLRFYSTTDKAGNAQFYLGDIAYKQGNFEQAVREYDKVLEQYPGNNKAAAAQLKKGYALVELGQKEAAVRELQNLVARYPRSPEATQARERLRKLGASPARPRR
ncbi:MAG: tetratricopeptide repeat protein [Terriglobales bacterium]